MVNMYSTLIKFDDEVYFTAHLQALVEEEWFRNNMLYSSILVLLDLLKSRLWYHKWVIPSPKVP
jgi:hypothetical protein